MLCFAASNQYADAVLRQALTCIIVSIDKSIFGWRQKNSKAQDGMHCKLHACLLPSNHPNRQAKWWQVSVAKFQGVCLNWSVAR